MTFAPTTCAAATFGVTDVADEILFGACACRELHPRREQRCSEGRRWVIGAVGQVDDRVAAPDLPCSYSPVCRDTAAGPRQRREGCGDLGATPPARRPPAPERCSETGSRRPEPACRTVTSAAAVRATPAAPARLPGHGAALAPRHAAPPLGGDVAAEPGQEGRRPGEVSRPWWCVWPKRTPPGVTDVCTANLPVWAFGLPRPRCGRSSSAAVLTRHRGGVVAPAGRSSSAARQGPCSRSTSSPPKR